LICIMAGGPCGERGTVVAVAFQNLCRAKTSNLQNLCSQPSNQMRAGV
jgi:hypothetical protein